MEWEKSFAFGSKSVSDRDMGCRDSRIAKSTLASAGGIGLPYMHMYVVCIIHNSHVQVMDTENSTITRLKM